MRGKKIQRGIIIGAFRADKHLGLIVLVHSRAIRAFTINPNNYNLKQFEKKLSHISKFNSHSHTQTSRIGLYLSTGSTNA